MVDADRRKFLKHLGYVSAAGVVGLGVAQFASGKGDVLVDDLEEVEQERGFRKVWATKRDEESNYGIPYAQYNRDALHLHVMACTVCDYVYDVTEGRKARFDELPSTWTCPACTGATRDDFEDIGIAMRSGGQPLVNAAACAYHYDEDGDGQYQAAEERVFCTMPCELVCPVQAISKGALDGTPRDRWEQDHPKLGPVVDYEACIRCGKCHKICGYNAIEWVNQAYKALGPGEGVHGGGG
jgi:rubredoxin